MENRRTLVERKSVQKTGLKNKQMRRSCNDTLLRHSSVWNDLKRMIVCWHTCARSCIALKYILARHCSSLKFAAEAKGNICLQCIRRVCRVVHAQHTEGWE
eukprot:scpid97639/ scgid34795/ 